LLRRLRRLAMTGRCLIWITTPMLENRPNWKCLWIVMIVVSNTSPLTNLAAIEEFDLLRQMYTHVYIPQLAGEK